MQSRMVMPLLLEEAAGSTLTMRQLLFLLQIDGTALSHRQVARFDSNTPRDGSHSFVHISLRSLASAGRYLYSQLSTRAPQTWLKA